MKLSAALFMGFLVLSFIVISCPQVLATGPLVADPQAKIDCSKDPSGNTVCKRPAPPHQGSSVVTQPQTKAAGKKPCKFTCTVEQGVEICRGNGPQCDGQIPYHWIK
jgi:hypothetical protein